MPTKRFAAVAWSALLLSVAAQSRAAETDALLPYLNESTAGVLRIDVEKVDLPKLVTWYLGAMKRANAPADILRELDGRMVPGAAMAQGMVQRVLDTGVKRVYLVINLDEQYRPNLVVVAPTPAKMPDAKALAESVGMVTLVSEKDLVVTDRTYAKKIVQIPAVARQDLTGPLPGGQGAIIASMGLHSTVRDRLVKERGEIKADGGVVKTSQLTDGMQHILAEISLAPIGVKYVVESKDKETAAELKALFEDRARKSPADASWADLIQLASPKQDGNKLVNDLKEQDMDKLVALAMPAVIKAREAANRVKSASNIRQMMLGMIMYSNDNKGMIPAAITDLDKYLGGPVSTTQIMTNPMRPELATEGYVYVPAPEGKVSKIRNVATRLAIYEAGDFGQGVNVGFWDGHVELIADKERFEKLLDEAKAK